MAAKGRGEGRGERRREREKGTRLVRDSEMLREGGGVVGRWSGDGQREESQRDSVGLFRAAAATAAGRGIR